jgi:hypothetical protein
MREGWGLEVDFYNRLAPSMSRAIVRCYDAAYQADPAAFHLLLEDLSQTHFQTPWPLPPLQPQCEQAVDCLAELHTHWWEHSRFGQDIGQNWSEADERESFRYLEQTLPRFIDFLGDRLSVVRRNLYEKVLPTLLALTLPRLEGRKGLTLVHLDAHVWNFLFPREPDRETARLIDWSIWGIGTGPSDLAYMMALHWYPERRQQLEAPLLKHYHHRLLEWGILGYDWDACWYDYRLAVMYNLFIPMEQWANNLSPAIWWPHVERAFLAFEDLQCAEFLQG